MSVSSAVQEVCNKCFVLLWMNGHLLSPAMKWATIFPVFWSGCRQGNKALSVLWRSSWEVKCRRCKARGIPRCFCLLKDLEEGSDVLNTHKSSSSLTACHRHNAADLSSPLLLLVPDMAEEKTGCCSNHFTEAIGALMGEGKGFVGNRNKSLQCSTVLQSSHAEYKKTQVG